MEERMELLTNNLPFMCAMIGVIGVLFAMLLAGIVKGAPAGDEKTSSSFSPWVPRQPLDF
jgi:K(+)-stimulated pyrophosphate-energized sodium pump